MDLQIKGKTAIVTGSTDGIGWAIARELASEGANVVINGRSSARVEAAVRELSRLTAPTAAGWKRAQGELLGERLGEGGEAAKVIGVIADLATAEGAEHLLRQVPHADILINNLGVFESRRAEDLEDADWQRMFDVNVLSGVRLTQLYLAGMKQQNWGRVIFIASEAGVNIPADMLHYGVSKAAQIAVARGFAEVTRGTRVTVNAILPGPTMTSGVRQFLADVPELVSVRPEDRGAKFIQQLRPTSLIERFAEPEEVAALVAYVASARSAATNGAALRVEGGLLRNA